MISSYMKRVTLIVYFTVDLITTIKSFCSRLFIHVGRFQSHCPHLLICHFKKKPLVLQKFFFVLWTKEKEGQGCAEELHCQEGCLLPQYLFSSFINFLLEIDTWLQLSGTEHGYGIVRNAGSHLSACQDLHNHTNIPNGQTDSCKGACQSSSAQLCHSHSIIVQKRVHKHPHTPEPETWTKQGLVNRHSQTQDLIHNITIKYHGQIKLFNHCYIFNHAGNWKY